MCYKYNQISLALLGHVRHIIHCLLCFIVALIFFTYTVQAYLLILWGTSEAALKNINK